jgi:hypothetical protein
VDLLGFRGKSPTAPIGAVEEMAGMVRHQSVTNRILEGLNHRRQLMAMVNRLAVPARSPPKGTEKTRDDERRGVHKPMVTGLLYRRRVRRRQALRCQPWCQPSFLDCLERIRAVRITPLRKTPEGPAVEQDARLGGQSGTLDTLVDKTSPSIDGEVGCKSR